MISLFILLGAIIYVCSMIAGIWAHVSFCYDTIQSARQGVKKYRNKSEALYLGFKALLSIICAVASCIMFALALEFIASLNIAAL